MIIDITPKSFNDIIFEANKVVSDAIYELKYNSLLDKFNYLQENGVVLESVDISKVKEKVQNIIRTIIDNIKKIWEATKDKVQVLINKIKAKRDIAAQKKAEARFNKSMKFFDFTMNSVGKIMDKVVHNHLSEEEYYDYVDATKDLFSNFQEDCRNIAREIQDVEWTPVD